MANKLEKLGYEKMTNNLYKGEEGFIIYSDKKVIIKDKIFDLEFLNALINSRPKSYAGRKSFPIPNGFENDVMNGLTYPQLMDKYKVARRTIAKWKRLI